MVSIFKELLIFRIDGSNFVWNYIRDDNDYEADNPEFYLKCFKKERKGKGHIRETHLQNDSLDTEVVKETECVYRLH